MVYVAEIEGRVKYRTMSFIASISAGSLLLCLVVVPSKETNS